MRNILTLFRKDVSIFIRDRPALIVTFIVPAVLILLFGYLFGPSSNASGDGSGARVMVVDEARDDFSTGLVEALRKCEGIRVVTETEAAQGESPKPLDEAAARARIANDGDKWRHLFVIPKNYQKEDGIGFRFRLVEDTRYASETQIVSGMIEKTLYTDGMRLMLEKLTRSAEAHYGACSVAGLHADIADSLARRFGMDREEALRLVNSPVSFSGNGAASGGALDNLVSFEREKVYGRGKNFAVQNVGGWAIMFLLFVVSGSASALLVEKREDMFVRLLSGPATRSQILWSKYLFVIVLGLFQMAALLLFGHVFYHIFTAFSQIGPVALVLLAGSTACGSIGMVLASLCKTEAQANSISSLVILSMCSVGGAMFPLFMLPAFVQDYVAPLTPVYWAMDGVFAVLWRDGGFRAVLPHVGILLLIAAVLIPVALWRFRTSDLFS